MTCVNSNLTDILAILSLFETLNKCIATVMAVFTDLEILLGTYDEYVIGYKHFNPGINYDLNPNFTVKVHLGPVRCITIHNW